MKSLFIIFTLLMISACGLFSANESTNYIKSKQYENRVQKNIPKNWNEIKSEGSDFAIQNSKTNSIFLLNTACRKTDASSLDALTSSILSGISGLEIISKNNIQLYERDAVELRVKGSVDGVKTFFNIVTVQKNFCIYDYVLISNTLKKLDNDYNSYKQFIGSIIPQ